VTGDSFGGGAIGGGGAEVVTVELDPAEAMSGTTRTIAVPPGPRALTIPIPPGVDSETMLVWPGMGSPDPAGGPPGDLVVRVQIRTAAGPIAPMMPPVAAPRRRLWPSVIAGSVLVLLLAVFVAPRLLRMTANSANPGTSPPATAAGTPSPSVTAVTAEEYQRALAALDTNLTPPFGQLAAAHSPVALRDTATKLQASVVSEVDKLRHLEPPPEALAAHRDLMRGLDELGVQLGQTASAAAARQVCAGSSALSAISRSAAASAVRAAATALAGAGPYRAGSFLPAPVQVASRRLGNGTMVKRQARSGAGRLKILNGGATDTAVSLVPAGGTAAVLVVYVRGKSNHTVSGIRDGSYRIYLASGTDWDSGTRGFTRDCEFQQFDDAFDFTTKRSSSGTQYTEWTITLEPVVGGNARTSEVDPEDFPSG
jgi:DnaJ C terminal domain